MKKNLFTRLSLLFVAFALSSPLASCTFFNTGGTQISNVITTYDDSTGNTIVTITFSDDEISPVSFIIPRGISGKDGVSIKNVTSKLSSDGNSIELTITYTDSSVQDTVISVPVLQGRGIKEVQVDKDEEGNPTIQFVYTDGTLSPIITMPAGKDGKGIESFEVSEPDSSGRMTIVIKFSDGSSTSFEIKNGKDAISISNITYNEEKSDATHYVLTITYTDGYTEDVSLDRPRSNRWFTGSTSPEEDKNLSEATEGDFYINRVNGYLYQKGNDDKWAFLFCMKGDGSVKEDVYYKVIFDPKEGKIDDYEGVSVFNVLEGKTISLANIPTPVYENHTFLGWYTDLDNVNAGKFTDLTPVMSDLHLYAKYSLNA